MKLSGFFSSALMDNKEEKSIVVEKQSGVMDQANTVPAVGAGVGESKTSDPSQAEPTPGDRSEQGDDDPTCRRDGRHFFWVNAG